MQNRSNSSSAFTLLELAVVLSIIALLLGAIFGGQQLLKQSELQTVLSDYGKYSTAVAQFRQQYGGLPGDLLDATNFWGDDNANCPDAAVDNGSPGTCNGDNDGDMSDGTEPYRAWQQLMLAKLIDGNYSGTGASALPGTNVPKGKILNSGWSFFNNTTLAGNANWYSQDIGNYLAFGAPVSGGITEGPVITTEEALQIDKKMDDGIPSTGRVVSLKKNSTNAPNCASDTADASAAYNLATKGPLCGLNMSLTSK